MNTPEIITELKPFEVFVFGSNTEGKHYGGAAKIAHEKFGAVWGEGVGHFGQTYAIPTLIHPTTETGEAVRMPLHDIEIHVQDFLDYAWFNRKLTFLVTPIGCGIAGFDVEQIAPLFHGDIPPNVILPKVFEDILNPTTVSKHKEEMNTDLSIKLEGETALEYYKRVRIVLEDRIKDLEEQLRVFTETPST